MSKSKEKRIKKLKKKRLWPSIVGMVLVSIMMFGIMIAILFAAIFDVINRKILDSYNLSAKVAEIFEDNQQSGDLYDDIVKYINYFNDMEQVSIVSDDGNHVWASHEVYPNIDDVITFESISFDSQTYYDIIIADDREGIIQKDGDKYGISDNILDKINFKAIFVGNSNYTYNYEDTIINLKIWHVITVEDNNIFVLYNLRVYGSEIFMFAIICVLVILLVIIFFIYYIFSLIGIIKNQRNMTRLIYTDMITGGNNWLYFGKKGAKLLKKNRRNKYNYAMIHLRMEKYRSFCTCFGVKEGEELIEKFYVALRKNIKRYETVAHHEKADFGLLITYVDKDELLERIDNIQSNLNQVVSGIKLYFSVGICLDDGKCKDIEILYNNASLARGMLSEDSEKKIAFYDIEMNKQQQWERRVENDMEKALINKEFQVYLQPKYSTKEEKLAGAEALVRWIHPSEGFIPPGRFIPIFEKNGFILQLDDYMLEEISRQQSLWLSQGLDLIPISVNVSRAHFTREDLAEHICGIVDKYNVPHQYIELELTESAFFDDKEVLLDTVKKLREFGFIVSMDDFGAGYSSLNSLKELSIDVLKIDADFFRGAESVERGMLIVSEVIDLAKKLDMKIVAEGIESKEQVEFLAEQECDLIQGYYFAKPMPINEFEEKYRTAQ